MTFRVLWWPLAFLDRDLCQNIHIIRVYLKWLSIKACHHNITLSIFFFYQGFLSRTRMIHRTAGEGRGPFFIPLYHFHPLMNIQTFICNFACEMTIHIFNRNACIYQTATRWYFTTLSNYHLFDWLMMWSLFLFTWWFDTRFLLQQFWYGKPVDSNYHPCITSEPTNQVC